MLVHGARFGWGWYLVVLVAGWLVAAYLTLPRLHRILSSIYVPNYFIGRTRTSDGLLGDPVNVAFAGVESQLHHAMRSAGWTQADEITPASTWRIVTATLTGRSYDEAPVSPLFLFGRRQDFAYQQEVDGNPGKRHHVRFWRCPDGWLLPGGRRVDWLAAGTYDRAIGFSLFTLQVTHKIDENTDIERDHIVATVLEGNGDARVTVIEDFSTGYHSRNGGGDAIVTDGDLPIVDVRSLPVDAEFEAEQAEARRALILDSTGHDFAPEEAARVTWEGRPLALVVGCALAVLAALVGTGRFLWQLRNFDEVVSIDTGLLSFEASAPLSAAELTDVVWVVVFGVSIASIVLQLVLALLAVQGRMLARWLLMAVLLASAVATLGFASLEAAGRVGLLIDFANLLLLVTALLALSSTASREFVADRRRKRRKRRLAGREARADPPPRTAPLPRTDR
ncbi:MAG: hypothetical protein GXX90_09205 [Microbacteriaceae bacterium]|nr:hypothetical protein [Microbacteriaceae bacterium]